MNLLFVLAAFVSVVPLLLLLSVKTIPEYSSRVAGIARFFPYRTFSFAVLAGGLVGVVSAFATLIVKGVFLPEIELAAAPSEALTWTIYIAFIYAGFAEEIVKCVLAFLLVLIVSSRREADGRRAFLKSTPFVCGAVGMGFALTENYDYLQFPGSMPALLLARGLLAAPVHTAINFNFGLSLYRARGEGNVLAGLQALVAAVLYHGIYDFFAIPSGAFSGFLTLVSAVLFLSYVTGRMYQLLPETRARVWVEKPSEPEGEADEEAEESPWQMSPGALRFLEQGLLRDPHREIRPPQTTPPFPEEEYPFPSEHIRDAFLRYEFRGPDPVEDREYREFFEAKMREAFLPAPAYVWDTAVFADLIPPENAAAGDDLFQMMQSMGIDLTRLLPLRVLEFSPSGRYPGGYRYVSCGLGPLLGRELFLSFPHPFSLARIFLTAAAAGLFHEAPVELQPEAIDSRLLGDPRGWFRGVLPVPLLDPVRESLRERLEGRCPLPTEILYLSRPDLRLIRRYGVQNYFSILKEADESWFNDFLRAPLEIEEE